MKSTFIVSENSKLKYEIQLDDETYKVSSPSTVFIPKGIRHKAKFISGKGIFVCIILSGKYKSSKNKITCEIFSQVRIYFQNYF